MDVDVLGAGPAYSDRPGSSGAAYLVREGDTSLLLDLGQGSFPRLAAALEPSTLSAVVISHLHPDHFIDLVALRHYLRWQFKPGRRVRVVAPACLTSRLDALHDEPGFTAAVLDVEDVSPGSFRVEALEVTAARVTHTADSHAYRVAPAGSDGPALVYSGDCGRAEDLEPLIKPGDTLLVEVSFGPGPVIAGANHLDGPAVGALAARARVGCVLLTHLQMGYDEAATLESVRERFSGDIRLVAPGDRFMIVG
jgi:ribonuclease BN (tRNA processing enzyme)